MPGADAADERGEDVERPARDRCRTRTPTRRPRRTPARRTSSSSPRRARPGAAAGRTTVDTTLTPAPQARQQVGVGLAPVGCRRWRCRRRRRRRRRARSTCRRWRRRRAARCRPGRRRRGPPCRGSTPPPRPARGPGARRSPGSPAVPRCPSPTPPLDRSWPDGTDPGRDLTGRQLQRRCTARRSHDRTSSGHDRDVRTGYRRSDRDWR